MLKKSQKTLLFWALLILMVIAIYNMFAPVPRNDADGVSFGQLMQTLRHAPERVKWLRISDDHWRGEWADGHRFHTIGPKLDGALVEQLGSVPFEVIGQESDWLTLLIGTWAPMLVLVGVFLLFMRKLQGAANQQRVAQLEEELRRIKGA